MPRSPAHDIAVLLNDNGYGTFPYSAGWGIAIGTEPSRPDDVITLYDTGGGVDQPDAELYDPTMQVRVRSRSYTDGYTKASDVRDFLILPTSREVGNFLYTGFWIFTDVAMIGRDDNDRFVFTFNLRLMREPLNQ